LTSSIVAKASSNKSNTPLFECIVGDEQMTPFSEKPSHAGHIYTRAMWDSMFCWRNHKIIWMPFCYFMTNSDNNLPDIVGRIESHEVNLNGMHKVTMRLMPEDKGAQAGLLHGGNSGLTTLNSEGEIVGIVFDSNIPQVKRFLKEYQEHPLYLTPTGIGNFNRETGDITDYHFDYFTISDKSSFECATPLKLVEET
jgi:hypothetical protein